jgi:Family of unknown function (DUF5675)
MQLQLARKVFTDQSTIGELSVDGAFECFTLEDVVRPEKLKGETAIPAGTYEIAVTFSNKFKKLLPLLLNVSDFEGVRIHSGNTPEDTEGCILVGQTQGEDLIGSSRAAFAPLFEKIQDAVKSEKVFIDITEQR